MSHVHALAPRSRRVIRARALSSVGPAIVVPFRIAAKSRKKVVAQVLERPGVIWITGFSASGKTTVGRKVDARLRAEGLRTVFLDGDDLRSIFGAKWGYTREERLELAYVYFRLCSHLASQGATVIISAVAMYREVSEWMHAHIPNSVEVYLNVPEADRRRRDTSTKKVYGQMTNMSALYDEPRLADLTIDNFGAVTPDDVARKITAHFLTRVAKPADRGRKSHWNTYYSQAIAPQQPSSFAQFVQRQLPAGGRVLEVGCGNGRDAAFFAQQNHRVTALDLSEAAIVSCQQRLAGLPIEFIQGALPEVAPDLAETYDAVYSRFVIHAMPLHEEVALLQAAADILKDGGQLHLECRSINDPMARLGKVISPTERIHGHYRRFIVLDELTERLVAAGFRIVKKIESAGLAVHGTEDPVVIRIKAVKIATQS